MATFSRQMNLRLKNGDELRARIKGKKLRPVCGDNVVVSALDDEPEWLITEILPRRTELTRPDSRGKIEILAANIDLLIVATADSPTTDWFIVDRYLAAARIMDIDAAIIFNKTDLAPPSEESRNELGVYADIGYTVVHCSANSSESVAPVLDLIADRTSIIVGQSGVGKSSLINRMIAGDSLRVGDLSASSGEGKHTTVNSALLPLPGGGGVIDSPGVRDYAPALDNLSDVANGFIEIFSAAQGCKFANCRHLREPGCAVKTGVSEGGISARRYESYKRLVHTTTELIDKRSP